MDGGVVFAGSGDGGSVRHWFFFFNDTATTEIYTLSLHDALPISVTVRVAACWTNPMQQACREMPVKSARRVNAIPMPSALSTPRIELLLARLIFGSAIAVVRPPAAIRAVILPSAAGPGSRHPAGPLAGGSSASIARRPPRYGSDAAVQPPAAAVAKPEPCRYRAVTLPVPVANGAELVMARLNGCAHAACRYRASVRIQPICDSDPGGSSLLIWPPVSAATD